MFISIQILLLPEISCSQKSESTDTASSGIQLKLFCFTLVLKAFADCNRGTFLSEVSVAIAESSVVATAVTESGVSKGGVSTAVSESVSSVAPQARVANSGVTVSVVGISLSIGISLGLSLSLTLAVVASKTGVSVTSVVSTAVAKSGVSKGRVSTAVSESVSSVAPQAKTGVTVSVV